MKPIKFRAWSEEDKKMYYGLSSLLELYDGDDIDHMLNLPTVMQFTGLKDKNGKEIYEGDIVLLNCGADDGATIRHKITATIEWDTNRWVARIPDKKVIVKGGSMEGKKLSWREIHTWCGMHDCLADTWVRREIIGNIYENPELLAQRVTKK